MKGNKKIKIEERKDEFIETEEGDINAILDKNKNNYCNAQNQNNVRRKKEINDYFIGNDSTIRNNNSTLVDVNEYYLNILESQQLLVNSKLKKIEDENDNNQIINNKEIKEQNIDKNYNEINKPKNNLQLDENELNTMSISKNQIKKINEKEITKTSNSKKVTEDILNTSSIEELKLKINSTLQRANIFLSKQNATNNNITENTTSNYQNNINNNTNSNNNTNNYNIKETKEEEEMEKEQENIFNNNDIQEKQINNKIEEEKNNLTNNEISKIESKKVVKQPLDSRVVLNLIEVIKFIIQRQNFCYPI